MTRWQKLSDLFETALTLPKKERESWLRDTCDDEELREEVWQMLKAHTGNSRILDEPADVYAAELMANDVDDEDLAEVRTVGRYRLLEEIGSGGMGKVYLAERADGHFEQRVAVKVLRSFLSAGHLSRRFVAERQILASLDHPNVGGILDGGVTDSGAPYFVMEYVEGIPITSYCRENGLSVNQRLELFLEVCDAVAHAHQRLVVHRDLKPSNILVTSSRHVKLLDFGIAKVLESDLIPGEELHTITGVHLMTPEYASPEQVRGDPISIASDVYQLGILLYELLVGKRPYELESHSVTEIARGVLETEPARPGSVIKLPSDLDAITMKALRKEPEMRYPSVDHLAADIRRYLAGRPVSAHRGSVGYRLGKFARRYGWAIAASVAFVMLLGGYAVTVTLQQARTARERDRAERYADFVTDLFASPDPLASEADIDQRDITVREFLSQASDRLKPELQNDPELRSELLTTMAGVYDNLGVAREGVPLLEEALPLSDQVHGRQSAESLEILRRLAVAFGNGTAEADSLYELQLALAPKVEPDGGPLTGRLLIQYGTHLEILGRLEEADSVLILAGDPANWRHTEFRSSPSEVERRRSRIQGTLANLALADSLIQVAYEKELRTSGPDHPMTALMLHQMGNVAGWRQDHEKAESIRRRVLNIWTKTLGQDHPYTISASNNLFVSLMSLGKLAEADSLARVHIAQRRRVEGDSTFGTANALQNLAALLVRADRLDEAESYAREAFAIFSAKTPNRFKTAFPMLSFTEIHLRREEYRQAEETASSAREILARTLPGDHPLIAIARSRRGAALTGLGRYDEAESELTGALTVLRGAHAFDQYRFQAVQAEEWLEELRSLKVELGSRTKK